MVSHSSATQNHNPPPAAERFDLRIVIHDAEEGGYWAEVPGFPEVVSEGDTLDEVRANIREAFLGMVEAMQERPTAPEPGRAEVVAL